MSAKKTTTKAKTRKATAKPKATPKKAAPKKTAAQLKKDDRARRRTEEWNRVVREIRAAGGHVDSVHRTGWCRRVDEEAVRLGIEPVARSINGDRVRKDIPRKPLPESYSYWAPKEQAIAAAKKTSSKKVSK